MSDRQLELEEQLRDEMRAVVEDKHEEWINTARREAVRISAKRGKVSAADLHEWAERTNNEPDNPLAYSAVFKGDEWVHTKEWTKSRHKGSHARPVMVWRYVSTIYQSER